MSFHVKRVTDWDELWQTFEECPFAYPVAGGTDIIPRVNQGIEKHEQFVCLEGLPDMRGVSFEADGSVRIGALTKLVEKSPDNPKLGEFAEMLYDQALLAEGRPIADPALFAKRAAALMTLGVEKEI